MNNIAVFYHHYSPSDELRDRLFDRLTPEQQARANNINASNAKLAYISSRSLLNQAFQQYAQIDITSLHISHHNSGKPYISHPQHCPWQFNLSHTNGLSVLAMGQGLDIGIDVESTTRSTRYLDIAKHYFHRDEITALEDINNAQQQRDYFYKLWTFKEAYLKALGVGLSHSLNSFAINMHTNTQDIHILHTDKSTNHSLCYHQTILYDHFICTTAIIDATNDTPTTLALFALDDVSHTFNPTKQHYLATFKNALFI